MEVNKDNYMILANYNLFNDNMIDFIKKSEFRNLLVHGTHPHSVGVCGSCDEYYCYIINENGKTMYSEKIEDFDTAIDVARSQFYIENQDKDDYSISNSELNNQGIINYLRTYDLTRLLENNHNSNSIGIVYQDKDNKYIVYENNERGVPFSNIQCKTFEDALEESRDYYRVYSEYAKSLKKRK